MRFFRARKTRRPESGSVEAGKPCACCTDVITRCLVAASQGHRSEYRDGLIERETLGDSKHGKCPVCEMICVQLKDRDSDTVTLTHGDAPAKIIYIEPCTSLDGYHAPGLKRITNPGMGDVHIARLDVFEAGSFASDLDFTAFDYGQEQLPLWKDIQKDIPVDMAREPTVALIEKWIDVCRSCHPQCKRAAVKPLPTRIIDIDRDRSLDRVFLCDSSNIKAPYVALSHRWGKPRPLETKEKNIDKHKRGIKIGKLPRTFRDAVMLLRDLSIRYIWIDSLCIIQDSKEDWLAEAATMAQVYSNALFTLSASDALSSDEGLFRQTPSHTTLTFGPLEYQGRNITVGVRSGLPLFRHETRDSPLANRGWIFQERNLPPAVLHFCRRQIYWECHQGIMSQAIPFHESQESSFLQQFGRFPKEIPLLENQRQWHKIIQSYSAREFTKPEDRAVAFLGISTKLEKMTGLRFSQGLCMQRLLLDLAWDFYSPREPLVVKSKSTQRHPLPAAPFGGTNEIVRLTPAMARRSRYPTWSWVSVDYPVSFHHGWETPFDSNFRVERVCGSVSAAAVGDARNDPPAAALHLYGTLVRSNTVHHSDDDWRISPLLFAPAAAGPDGRDILLTGSMDPGCLPSSEVFILPLSYPKDGNPRFEKMSFLILHKTDRVMKDAARRNIGVFERVGVGSSAVANVREVCEDGIVGSFIII